MSGKKCRGLRGFAAGGIVDVPGASRSGVADDIHVDDAPVGGFVLPADSVQALRKSNPELLAQILAVIQQAGGDADGAATAQIAISNGELFIPPEAVAALGGADVLNAIKDATHQQVNAPAAKPIDAPPPPGGVNAPLDAVVQPPRGLRGVGGAGVLPDAAMPGSGQAQQQRTFFKSGGAVARGLFTGGGMVRRRYVNGTDEEEEGAAKPPQNFNVARSPTLPQPVQQETSFAGDAPKTLWQTTAAAKPAQEFVAPEEATAQQAGWDLAAATRNAGEVAAEQNRVARELRANRQTFSSYAAARAPETPTTTPAPAATQQQPTTPANTAAPAAAQQGGWQGVGGLSGVAKRRREDGTWEYSNVPGANGGFASAHDPYKIPDQQAGGVAPASSLVGARVIEASAPVNTISSSAAASPSAATSNALHAARMAAAARGEPTGTEPRGLPGVGMPSMPQETLREKADRERALDALREAGADPRRTGRAHAPTARQWQTALAARSALQQALSTQQSNRQAQALQWQAAQQAAARQQQEMALRQREAAQPRGLPQVAPPSADEQMKRLRLGLMQGALDPSATPEQRQARLNQLYMLDGKQPSWGNGKREAGEWKEGKDEAGVPYHYLSSDPMHQIRGGVRFYGDKRVEEQEKR